MQLKLQLSQDEAFPVSSGVVLVPCNGFHTYGAIEFAVNDPESGQPPIWATLSIWDQAGQHYARRSQLRTEQFFDQTLLGPVHYTTDPEGFIWSQATRFGAADRGRTVKVLANVDAVEQSGFQYHRAWWVDFVDGFEDVPRDSAQALPMRQKKFDFLLDLYAHLYPHGGVYQFWSVFHELKGPCLDYLGAHGAYIDGPIVSLLSPHCPFLLGRGLFELSDQDAPGDEFRCFERIGT